MQAIGNMQKATEGCAIISAYSFPSAASISFAGKPVVAHNRPVGGRFFEVLQLQPALGRLIREEDNQASAPAVAVVSHGFFVSILGNNPNVIGQTLRIDNKPYQIIGVLPASFYGLVPGDSAQIYSPMWKSSGFAQPRNGKINYNDPRSWNSQVIARRNSGVAPESLMPSLQVAFVQSWQRKGQAKQGKADPTIRIDDASRGLGDLSRNFREPLLFSGALLGLVLLIACANIANLLLARATARAKEVALRISLGCTQGRLLRQFLTESAILATMDGLSSIGFAYATAKTLGSFLAGRDNLPIDTSIDPTMLASIGLISILTLVLFGLFPAWRASRLDTNSALKEGFGSLGSTSRN